MFREDLLLTFEASNDSYRDYLENNMYPHVACKAVFSVVIHKTNIYMVCTDTYAGLRRFVQINTSQFAYNVIKLKITYSLY